MTASSLRTLATDALTAELDRRQRLLPGLQRRHERLTADANRLAVEIAAMGGTVNGATSRANRGRPATGPADGGPRPGRALAQVLRGLLVGRVMTVTDAAAAARRAGYVTRAKPKGFYHAVAGALRGPAFKRVRRGRYTAAAGAPPGAPAASGEGTPDRRRIRTGPGSRPARPGSVVSVLQGLLTGKTMTVTEAVAAVRKAGYKTKATAQSFYSAVAFALGQSGRFRRVARGKYTAKA